MSLCRPMDVFGLGGKSDSKHTMIGKQIWPYVNDLEGACSMIAPVEWRDLQICFLAAFCRALPVELFRRIRGLHMQSKGFPWHIHRQDGAHYVERWVPTSALLVWLLVHGSQSVNRPSLQRQALGTWCHEWGLG